MKKKNETVALEKSYVVLEKKKQIVNIMFSYYQANILPGCYFVDATT